jgi:hypothetical protein
MLVRRRAGALIAIKQQPGSAVTAFDDILFEKCGGPSVECAANAHRSNRPNRLPRDPSPELTVVKHNSDPARISRGR